jgi:hypothetical protein
MGSSLYNIHHIVADVIGKRVEGGMFGEIDGLFLVIGVIDFDVDETFLKMTHHLCS